uniref:TBC1 domain family member 16 n=1 Tax=Panthera tigris altaica TaxID=74533 RepID=A0A8C9JNL9_PANTA
MSLGRLLRRASSKASDLLTLTPGGGGGPPSVLDGEIIYSKNNVCVHPPEGLQGLGEHHPGYLCLCVEKDELLGSTLILTWVPNSRIQRQDEEALRYITPESSPVRKAPRPRGRAQDGTEEGRETRPEAGEEEGSLELSAEGVSRDSSFDSDSDAFSSPFCLSPISAALVDSGSSVFLDSESGSPCGADTPLRFPDGQGLLQTPRWDEPQRACALRGHQRGGACTSGQLVIASRESQYKVFHFHHGGLDKLCDVFQQWKYCTETHLKDQVAQRATGRPRRGSRPAAETPSPPLPSHGGEGPGLPRAIFFGGIDVSIRGEVWPFLLRYYSHESTSQEREALRAQKRKEYAEIQQKRLSMTPEEHRAFWRNVQFTVDKDVVRTDRSNQFFRGEDNPNVESMRWRAALTAHAVYNPAIGYSQGMSDLVAPILAEVLDESDTFWCFVGLMQNTIFVSSPRDEDMEKQLPLWRPHRPSAHFHCYQHLFCKAQESLWPCHRALAPHLCTQPPPGALAEPYSPPPQTDYFHLFICVAIVAIYGDDVIEQQLATDQMLLHFGNLAMHMNGELVLRKARSLLHQFRLLPRIPCSLHDLCKTCGTGMWDSGYIPAVECTGHHPGWESCPYGGTVETPSPRPPREGKKGPKMPRDGFGFRR